MEKRLSASKNQELRDFTESHVGSNPRSAIVGLCVLAELPCLWTSAVEGANDGMNSEGWWEGLGVIKRPWL